MMRSYNILHKRSTRALMSATTCYRHLMDDLREIAARCDATVRTARKELVSAIRRASRAGMNQRAIAQATGRSQPEISRLTRLSSATPLGRKLTKQVPVIRRIVQKAGGRNVRVFGSVARGEDGPGSDIDLLFEMGNPLSLMELARLELSIREALDVDADLVPENSLRPDLWERVLDEAVPL